MVSGAPHPQIKKVVITLIRADGSVFCKRQTTLGASPVHFDLVNICSRDENFRYVGVHIVDASVSIKLISQLGKTIGTAILQTSDLYATLFQKLG